jgi:branched-chain amino acid transport system substrate-binding protein
VAARARLSRRRARAPLAGVAIVALLAACTGDDDDTTPSTTDAATTTTVPERVSDGVLRIGVFLPLTGPGAALGPPMVTAIEDAADTINDGGGVLGEPVELVDVDEGSGTFDDLLARGVDAIVGPASSTLALSSLRSAVDQTTGVVTCSPMATSLALDAYPDHQLFFRTAPSDSLQMEAIARVAERTGARSVGVGYLDDPYGRGLADAVEDALTERSLRISASSGFGGDQDDLSDVADEILADDPAVVVVLGDTDDGSRLLAALDDATADPPQVIINDSIRQARSVIQNLSPDFRDQLVGVAPQSGPATPDGPPGFFVAHAVDCVNLIALAAMEAGTDNPLRFRANMPSVSTGGRACATFAACASQVVQNRGIDYNGVSGPVDLSNVTGDPVRAWFEVFGFDTDGAETHLDPILVG